MRLIWGFNSLVFGLLRAEAGASAWSPLLWSRGELTGIGLGHQWLGKEEGEEFKRELWVEWDRFGDDGSGGREESQGGL